MKIRPDNLKVSLLSLEFKCSNEIYPFCCFIFCLPGRSYTLVGVFVSMLLAAKASFPQLARSIMEGNCVSLTRILRSAKQGKALFQTLLYKS